MNLSTTLRTLCVLTLLSGQVMAAKPTRGDLAFEKLVDLHWKQTLTASPFLAASLGDKDSANQLPDVSILQQVKRAQDSNKLLSKLNEIQPSKLSPTNQTNWAILRRLLIDGGLEFKYRTYLIPISNRSGFHMQFAEMHKSVPFQNTQDYRN
ncbi:MAG: hypothetical protein HOF72_08310, partial [Planctomycetaceae bacterium]|nr:hypothetical protein [Planctomycetaceae bacterium]